MASRSLFVLLLRDAHRHIEEDLLPPLRVRAHDVRGVATSMGFTANQSLDKILEAATWKTSSVFASHYLKDVHIIYDSCRALGPIVAAGSLVA